MHRFWFMILLALGLTLPLSTGCGSSYQDEDAARELVEQEDAETDIEAELAAEAGEE